MCFRTNSGPLNFLPDRGQWNLPGPCSSVFNFTNSSTVCEKKIRLFNLSSRGIELFKSMISNFYFTEERIFVLYLSLFQSNKTAKSSEKKLST